MDRAVWKQHLDVAERHVEMAERHVATQKQLVGELQRDGHPAEMAERILAAYEDLLDLHRGDCDRLKKELAIQTDCGVAVPVPHKPATNRPPEGPHPAVEAKRGVEGRKIIAHRDTRSDIDERALRNSWRLIFQSRELLDRTAGAPSRLRRIAKGG